MEVEGRESKNMQSVKRRVNFVLGNNWKGEEIEEKN